MGAQPGEAGAWRQADAASQGSPPKDPAATVPEAAKHEAPSTNEQAEATPAPPVAEGKGKGKRKRTSANRTPSRKLARARSSAARYSEICLLRLYVLPRDAKESTTNNNMMQMLH